MVENLDCSDQFGKALIHLDNRAPGLAATVLKEFKGCHLTHQTCPRRGIDCVAQDILEGYFEDVPDPNVALPLDHWKSRSGSILEDVGNDLHTLFNIGR